MKKFLLSLAVSFFVLSVHSQTVEAVIEYNKLKQPGVIAEYAVPVEVAEDVIKAEMKNRGLGKGDGTKGFTLYKGVNIPEISADKIDFYIKVEKKSKKDKANSVITAMASKGYDNFISGANDAKTMAALISFVNGLKDKFNTGNLEVQIKEQEDVVKKEEKKVGNIEDDIKDLEKKIEKLQKDIAEKKNDLEKQKSEVTRQRNVLDGLKAKKS